MLILFSRNPAESHYRNRLGVIDSLVLNPVLRSWKVWLDHRYEIWSSSNWDKSARLSHTRREGGRQGGILGGKTCYAVCLSSTWAVGTVDLRQRRWLKAHRSGLWGIKGSNVPGGWEKWQHGEVCVSKSVLLPGSEFNLWLLCRSAASARVQLLICLTFLSAEVLL